MAVFLTQDLQSPGAFQEGALVRIMQMGALVGERRASRKFGGEGLVQEGSKARGGEHWLGFLSRCPRLALGGGSGTHARRSLWAGPWLRITLVCPYTEDIRQRILV